MIDKKIYRATGELQKRVKRSQTRLESSPYLPEECFEKEIGYDWPADWIGRAFLGNVRISAVSGEESKTEKELYGYILKSLNSKGYLGDILTDCTFDEQQFSGHNWLVRGLIDYAIKYGIQEPVDVAKRIIYELYLPATDYYCCYPVKKEERVFSGEQAGTLTGAIINHWKTSSDTGCAFMCLDCLSDYYFYYRDEKVAGLLDKMIEKFCSIDFVGIQMQTHASLSATRGILRYYEATGKKELVDFAEKFAEMYLNYGATANYCNYNWFARPAWTEPCAIIDSYMMFAKLFEITGKKDYLRTSHRIYNNGIRFAQRANGGFGCDKCTDSCQPILRPDGDLDKMNEAFWCCSMRGGEGLSEVLSHALTEKGTNLIIGSPVSFEIKGEGYELSCEQQDFPSKLIKVRYRETAGKTEFKKILIYIPGYADNVETEIDGKNVPVSVYEGYASFETGESRDIVVRYDIPFYTENAIGKFRDKKATVCWYGDFIIGIPEDKAGDCKGVPFFRFDENGEIIDEISGLQGEIPGKNIDSLCDDGISVKAQSIKIVF